MRPTGNCITQQAQVSDMHLLADGPTAGQMTPATAPSTWRPAFALRDTLFFLPSAWVLPLPLMLAYVCCSTFASSYFVLNPGK